MTSDLRLQQLQPRGRPLPFRVGIIGGGRAGGAIARALVPNIAWVLSLSPQRRVLLRNMLPSVPVMGSLMDVVVLPELVILAVPDRAIDSTARLLAQQMSHELEGKIVVHLSGVHTVDVLSPIKRFGGSIGATHPFTMIPDPHPQWLYGAPWGVEADEQLMPILDAFVRATGGIPYYLGARLSPARKALYHVTAVFASNVVTSAIRSAVECAQCAGIPASLFVPPILRATLESSVMAFENGRIPPQTGPLARHDWQTIALHLEGLEPYKHLLWQYCCYTLAMLESTSDAVKRGQLQTMIGKVTEQNMLDQ